jgi:hypothetical protein
MGWLQNDVVGLVRRLWPANSEDMRREEERLHGNRGRIFIRIANRSYTAQDVCDTGDGFQESEVSVVRTVIYMCREKAYWGPIRARTSSLYAEGTASSPGSADEGMSLG